MDNLFQDEGQADDNEFDDLFGDGGLEEAAEPAVNGINGINGYAHPHESKHADDILTLPSARQPDDEPRKQIDLSDISPQQSVKEVTFEMETEEEREQRLLFESSRKAWERREGTGLDDEDIPPPPETDAELLATIWPGYTQDEIPRWQSLFPGKRAYYLYKTPIKPPKPIQPTKVNLDLEADQERQFKTAAGTKFTKRSREDFEDEGIIVIKQAEDVEHVPLAEDDYGDSDFDDDELVGGLSLNDLRILCEDWDIGQQKENDDGSVGMLAIYTDGPKGDSSSAAKRQKFDMTEFLQSSIGLDDTVPSFDNPAELTRRLAQRVPLEPSDPNLLLDFNPPAVVAEKKPRRIGDLRKIGGFTKQLHNRWNISQDKSYDLLKENHSHKIRATLTKLDVKHSLPALKMQYPFYKVQLSSREARSFHRPTMHLPIGFRISFDKPNRVKRATVKDKDATEVYATSKDLSMGDNSDMLLLEYSEECPTMLSNFGMNNRFINYYRRKDAEDTARPKGEIGETQVLLPHDNSPFSIFGNVEPGDMMPTIHNEMYRAPVFKQTPKTTDFVVMRSTTGVDGSQYFIRNIQNLYVAGQQFPYVEVPGTHSRKVTDASKTRLKMISFRVFGRNQRHNAKKPWLPHDSILKHVPGTDLPQNRSKMKEWMYYDAEVKSWFPKKGEAVPEEQNIRGWIAPEQVCLLDSMQVGHRHLQDAGYNKDGDDEDNEDQSTEQQMAPWQTTKNFLKACQGQAMLQLHGEGDPSGRGEAFSFIKTSMKGGFKAIGESIEDRLDARKKEELGGHKYNVARQQQAYNDAIRRIWDAQARSLSSAAEHSDVELDADDEPDHSAFPGRTPRSAIETPAATARSRADDDTASQYSHLSARGQSNKILRIRRRIVKYGREEVSDEIIHDPKIIREYQRRRRERNLGSLKYVP